MMRVSRGENSGGLNLPSIVPPLSITLLVQLVRNPLIDSNHHIGLVRSEAQNRKRTRKRADRFLERGGGRPLNVPGEPI